MNNTELILKMMELDGKKNFNQTRCKEKILEIGEIASDIESTKAEKSEKLRSKSMSDSIIATLDGEIAALKKDLSAIKDKLDALDGRKKDTQKTNANYDDDYFSGFDAKVDTLVKQQKKAEGEKSDIMEEGEKIQSEIDELQKELENQGISLSMSKKSGRSSVI